MEKYILCQLINNQNFSNGIPENIFSITSLKDLYLVNNNITSIPQKIVNLKNLRRLDLRTNKLTTISKYVGKLFNLKYLKLSNNDISSLPSFIGNLKSLLNLYLSNCKLTSIPTSIGNFSNLEKLLLKKNKLESIPNEIGNLKKLNELDLDNNCINELSSNLIGKKYVSFENNSASYCYSCERLKEQVCSSCNDNDFECAINSKGQIYHLKINNQDFGNGIPDIIFELTSINELYLLNDKISSISNKIGNITNLKRLDIRENNIETLPDNIGNLNKLKYLKLSKNPLTIFPSSVLNLKSLLYLYLSNCKLNSIPEEIENLTNLQKLLLANNYLRIIPDEIGNLKNLNELMLDNNCLDTIPNTIDTDKVSVSFEQNSISYCLSCTELKEIACKTCNPDDFICETNSKGYINSVTLNNQNFEDTNTFPSIITKITSLEILDLSNNLLQKFSGIENLINLQKLILNNNRFNVVPSGIEQLSKLQILKFTNNNIGEFPEIEKLINLRELYLNDNFYSYIPSGIEQLNKLQIFFLMKTSTLYRDFSFNYLENFPEIEKLINLQELNLSYNYIENFPGIEKLFNLQELYLNSNFYRNIPSGIERLNKLQILDLSRNLLQQFPEIENFINLQTLDLSKNLLQEFPEIENFINLQTLNLNDNSLEELPGIEKYINLQELLLKGNDFESVPSGINQLNKLKLVNLRNNEISSLPPEFEDSDIEILIGYVPDDEYDDDEYDDEYDDEDDDDDDDEDEYNIYLVRQGCHLSPILFNLFINDILNNCSNFEVSCGNSICCGGLFADEIVLITPTKSKLRALLSHVHDWAKTNEMTFGINKWATMVVKPLKLSLPHNYSDPTFFLGINRIPKTSTYKYRIPLAILFLLNLLFLILIQNLDGNLSIELLKVISIGNMNAMVIQFDMCTVLNWALRSMIMIVSCYTCLGIPFSNDLYLKLIIDKIYNCTKKSLYSLSNFFMNSSILLAYKKKILQFYVISKPLYYAPLINSNQSNTKKIQTLINTGMFWHINSFNSQKSLWVPVICIFLELLFDRYKSTLFITKSVNVE
ncbi:L domain-like protein [Anaeromyces robustus]|uniref:L domain-like protein n=1 Tax=Anaeromyces robustus TaxID=1754192 RepID=A0A1Y1W6N4_9FUNG|nr:L domain-like protein [Anaeromyces robustus]|eukprot:ORX68906.1 L domain-like protein [Anaeromyces robustus]